MDVFVAPRPHPALINVMAIGNSARFHFLSLEVPSVH
ncbi:hypothetical protein ILFOPFJJ_06763 [Ensifer psoraleae]|nr:hypothetical protein [Sinorhizobium psoraleae]